MKKFDLHMHTSFSDGTLTPTELVHECEKIGLAGISITDHDTVEAYHHLPKTSLRIGVGVEFSTFFQNESVHVLGYDFNLEHHAIKDLCQRHIDRRLNRNLAILKNLSKFGITITEDELYSRFQDRSVGRPHIAKILIERGICSNIDHAFREFLAEGKKAYAQGELISTEETLNVIHAARGKAFVAHPHFFNKRKFIDSLFALPFDGVETFYARFPRSDVMRFEILAKEKNWLISGGSDFHGDMKTFNQLGSSFVDETLFNKIFQHPIN